MLHMHCNIPYYMFDCWADPVVHLLLLKSSMVMEEMRLPVSEWERERDCKFVWVSGRERKKTTTTGNKVHQEAQSKSHQNTDVWFDSKSLEKNLFESEKFESLMRATIRCVSERERERERGKICWNESGVFIIASLPLSLSLSLLCFYHFKMVWKFFDFLNDTPPMAAAVIVLTFGLFEKQHLLPFHTKLFNCLFLLSFLLSSR